MESWNGTSWTETTDMNTARYYLAEAGTTTAALAMGGETTPPTALSNATEEFVAPTETNETIPD